MDERFDVVVIGGGPAGEAAVRRLAGSGRRVALIERERVGGECAYWACVPSKVFLRAPEVRAEALRVRGLSEPEQSFAEVAAYRDFMVSGLDDSEKAAAVEETGATLIRGEARLAGPGLVRVGERELSATEIVVATGSEDVVPEIAGLAEVPTWTTRDLYGMTSPPRAAIVLGGGPVGVEATQMLLRYGCAVTLVETRDRLLAREQPVVGEHLARLLGEGGAQLQLGAEVARARVRDGRAVLELESGETLEAERVILAVGREPRVDDLDLEAAGATFRDDGGIDVDEQCRAAEGLYAVGDVTNIAPFTHVAHYQGEIAVDCILGVERRADYRAIPRVVFTDPEIACVGQTTAEAKEAGIQTAEAQIDIQRLTRSRIHGVDTDGVFGILVDRRRQVLLGAWAVGPLASEWIGASVLAIKARIPLATLRDTPAQFPTFGEALGKALAELG